MGEGGGVQHDPDRREEFERLVLPLLPSAYNVARWLTRNDSDAEDVVQEAFLRAFRFFGSFRGSDPRGWLLAIVRNSGLSWLRANRPRALAGDPGEAEELTDEERESPEEELLRRADGARVRRALEELAVEFREVLVLRELEELSYREISEVTGLPVGTVMSRLSRGRRRLQAVLGRPSTTGART
ncbi:MAG TPA: sigma-70 family RNA polymerase sigma factor [Thermoanaerobaculia bacterium]|nr:sigma-70 family RNA polymerase sigma factor [Thermoanaerobaculia bacterium]